MPLDDKRLAELPAAAAKVLKTAVAAALVKNERGFPKDDRAIQRASEAAEAVAFPADIPLRASELTSQQRVFAELVALADELPLWWARGMPKQRWVLRRWLGIDPPSALEREIDAQRDGKHVREPLWRVLSTDPAAAADAMAGLSVADRLEVHTDIMAGAYYLGTGDDTPAFVPRIELEALHDEGRTWAPRFADVMINDPITTRFTPRDALFLALVRAKVPVEPRWDQLLPVTLVQTEPALFRECLEAIPRERRTAAIKPYLGVSPPRGWTDIFAAVAPIHPEPDLVEAMFAIYKAYAERPDAAARAALEDVAKRVPELAASIAQHLAHKKVAPLVFERVPLPPRDKLTSLQKKQLAWFEQEGGDWAVLELFAVRDAKGKHLYDATIHAGDDGYVFRAGTATKVATFAQGGCEAKGEALMAGLEQGLADSMRGRKKAGPGKPAASAAVTSGAAKPRRSPKPRRATRAR